MGSLPSQLAKQGTVNGTTNVLLLGNSSGEESDGDDSEDGFVGDLEKEMLMHGK
jgi:hypothetical protein